MKPLIPLFILAATSATANPLAPITAEIERVGASVQTLGEETKRGFARTENAFGDVQDGFRFTEAELRHQHGLIASAAALGNLRFPSGEGWKIGFSAAIETKRGHPAFAGGIAYETEGTLLTFSASTEPETGAAFVAVSFGWRL